MSNIASKGVSFYIFLFYKIFGFVGRITQTHIEPAYNGYRNAILVYRLSHMNPYMRAYLTRLSASIIMFRGLLKYRYHLFKIKQ